MARDPETYTHQEWLGYVQQSGLVVSIPALLAAQAFVNRNIAPDQQRFLAFLPRDKNDEIIPEIRDFPAFAEKVLGWAKPTYSDGKAASRFLSLSMSRCQIIRRHCGPPTPFANSSQKTWKLPG